MAIGKGGGEREVRWYAKEKKAEADVISNLKEDGLSQFHLGRKCRKGEGRATWSCTWPSRGSMQRRRVLRRERKGGGGGPKQKGEESKKKGEKNRPGKSEGALGEVTLPYFVRRERERGKHRGWVKGGGGKTRERRIKVRFEL